jgi:DnaJ-class molecular chaperone
VAPLVAPVTAPRPTASGDPSTEIRRRAETLNALDYFQLLGLPTTASAVEVKRAFHAESRAYHPDRFFHLTDVTFKTQVHEVYKRITEAYFVLRDETKRRKYLADITGPDRVRKLRFDEMAEQETKAAVKREVEEQIGVHPKGRQFFQVAMAELDRGQLAAAERNLKLALTYESQNTLYKDKLAQVQEMIHEEFRREGKAFKIT